MENHEVFVFSHTQFCHSFCLLTPVSATRRVVLRLPGSVPAPWESRPCPVSQPPGIDTCRRAVSADACSSTRPDADYRQLNHLLELDLRGANFLTVPSA